VSVIFMVVSPVGSHMENHARLYVFE